MVYFVRGVCVLCVSVCARVCVWCVGVRACFVCVLACACVFAWCVQIHGRMHLGGDDYLTMQDKPNKSNLRICPEPSHVPTERPATGALQRPTCQPS